MTVKFSQLPPVIDCRDRIDQFPAVSIEPQSHWRDMECWRFAVRIVGRDGDCRFANWLIHGFTAYQGQAARVALRERAAAEKAVRIEVFDYQRPHTAETAQQIERINRELEPLRRQFAAGC